VRALVHKGTHFTALLRDLQRDVVAADILAWLAMPAAPLPSGADAAAAAWLAREAAKPP